MDLALKMRLALTAIAHATDSNSFGEIIESERDAFRGLHVTYATRAIETSINEVRIDEVSKECAALCGFYDGTGVMFYSDRVYRDTLAGQAKFGLDYSIMLDKNVCEAARQYVAGKIVQDAEAFKKLLDLFRGRGTHSFNYDFMAYLAEELEHIEIPRNDRPLATFRALKRLDYIDDADLAAFPVLPFSEEKDAAAALAVEDLFKHVIRTGALAVLVEFRLVVYALLLKAAILRWRNVSVTEGMVVLVDFCLGTTGKIAKTELYLASKLLSSDRYLHRFFHPVKTPGHKALSRLRSMAWDLSQFRAAEAMHGIQRVAINGTADFFVPFLASFDGRFRDMVNAFPVKATVVHRSEGMINTVFRDELQFQTLLHHALREARYDPDDRRAAMARMKSELNVRQVEGAVRELEQEIMRMV